MQFQFNSDNSVDGNADVADEIETLVRSKLSRVSDLLSRVEVHVRDVNGPRDQNGMRCAVELRPTGMRPVSAADEASTIEAAVASATDKALSVLSRQMGKQTSRKGH